MTGGERGAAAAASLRTVSMCKPTVFVGHNKMRIFQEEIFGPVLSVTTFKNLEEAIEIGNDTIYGLGAGVWSRNVNDGLPRRPGNPGRPCLDQLLSRVSGARRVRRVQAVGLRARDPQDDAGSLSADEEPPGQLQPECDGPVLISTRSERGRLAGMSRTATQHTSQAVAGCLVRRCWRGRFSACLSALIFTPQALALTRRLQAANSAAWSFTFQAAAAKAAPRCVFDNLTFASEPRRTARRNRGMSILCRVGAVRLLGLLPTDRRRDEGRRRQFLDRSR